MAQLGWVLYLTVKVRIITCNIMCYNETAVLAQQLVGRVLLKLTIES